MIWLSIVIPCYNVANYLPACLGCILRNNVDGVELILVNDGSVDGFAETVQKFFGTTLNSDENRFAFRGLQVVVLQQQNQGVSTARNKGIQVASGTYVTFIDPDDQISASCFTSIHQHCSQGQRDVVILGYTLNREDEMGNVISRTDVLPRRQYNLTEREQVIEQLLPRYLGYSVQDMQDYGRRRKGIAMDKEQGYVWRCVYDRRFLMEQGIRFHPYIKCNEDGLFNMQCLAKATRVDTMMECHYIYTIRADGAFMNRLHYMIQNKLELLRERIQLVEQLQGEGFDIGLNSYAGSNVLSAVELMKSYKHWRQIRAYICHPVVRESIRIMPFIGNWKFDVSLALLKLRMGRVLFWCICMIRKLGISIGF